MKFERAIIIRDKTRLEQLIERFNSKAQAKFYIESSGGDFNFYELEHDIFYVALLKVKSDLRGILKHKVINRSFLPTYIFTENDSGFPALFHALSKAFATEEASSISDFI